MPERITYESDKKHTPTCKFCYLQGHLRKECHIKKYIIEEHGPGALIPHQFFQIASTTSRLKKFQELHNDAYRKATQRAEKDTVTLRNRQVSPLLQLPAEIREMIYAYAIGGHLIFLEGARRGFNPVLKTVVRQPGLLDRPARELLQLSNVSRQLRFETKLLPFQLNESGFEYSRPLLDRLVDRLVEEQRNAIKDVWVKFCHFECLRRIENIKVPYKRLSGLKKITINAVWMAERGWLREDSGVRIKSLIEERAGDPVRFILEGRRSITFNVHRVDMSTRLTNSMTLPVLR